MENRRTRNYNPPVNSRMLPGFAYQHGVLLAGSVGYVEAILAQHTNYTNAIALTAFVVFTLPAVVIALGREKRGIQFGS